MTATAQLDSGVPHASQRLRSLLHSIGSSAVTKVMSVGLSLVSVPIALGYLGAENYGLWATVTSLVGMLTFADLGIGNGIMNSVSNANGRDDPAGVRRAIACGTSAVALAAAVLLLVSLIAWPFIDWGRFLAIHGEAAGRQAGWAVLTLLVLFALNMPVAVVQKVQYGMQEGRWVSLSQGASAVFNLGLILLVVKLDLGVVGMVACFVLAGLLADSLSGGMFLNRHRDIIPRRTDWDRPETRRLLKVGLSFLVLQLGASLSYASDNIIIAHILGQESVAQYSVHQKLFSPINFVAGLALTPLWPAFADAETRGDHAWIKKTLAIAGACMFLIGLAGGGLLYFASDWLMLHWLKGRIAADHALCLAFVAWMSVDLAGRCVAMFLNGAGMLRQQLLIVAIFVPLCIVLKIVLVGRMGVAGVVVGTVVAWLMVHVPAYSALLRNWSRSKAATASA